MHQTSTSTAHRPIRRALIAAALCLAAAPGLAARVDIVGLSSGRAIVSIDGGKPRVLRPGETGPGGVKLISVGADSAVFEIDGQRETVRMGEQISTLATEPASARAVLQADRRGHFVTSGSINGAVVTFMVDTGATLISLGPEDARRAGVKYLQGERAFTSTANGLARVYKVKLDTVKLGDITLTNVDALVHERDSLPFVLLGNSFLSRLEMRREGDQLTLIKKY